MFPHITGRYDPYCVLAAMDAFRMRNKARNLWALERAKSSQVSGYGAAKKSPKKSPCVYDSVS